MLEHEDLTGKIIAAAVKVHGALGPGLLESVYEHCLARELAKGGLTVARQMPIPIKYDGEILDAGFRADLVVEGVVIVELKAVDRMIPIHEAQLITHLRLSGIRIGLLFNFNQLRVTDNMVRRII